MNLRVTYASVPADGPCGVIRPEPVDDVRGYGSTSNGG